MVIVFEETRIISGSRSKIYNLSLYWGQEHRLSLHKKDDSTIIFVDRHYSRGGNTTLLWPKKITIKLTNVGEKVSLGIKLEPINKAVDKEEYLKGMRNFWIDILVSFWRHHGVRLSDSYYRLHYSLDLIKTRCKMRYNQIIFYFTLSIITITLSSYYLSYFGFIISILLCILMYIDELFFHFRFVNITKLSKKLYPNIDPIESRKMNLLYLYDRMITFDPFK
jgi:hypothetical protein